MDIPFEKAICKGCCNENGIIPFLDSTEPCVVFKCIKGKEVDFFLSAQIFPVIIFIC